MIVRVMYVHTALVKLQVQVHTRTSTFKLELENLLSSSKRGPNRLNKHRLGIF
jgi:hypothetical protein